MSAKLLIGLIVVIALSSSDNSTLSVDAFEYKPCEGFEGPVMPMTIDSCPDPSKVDACEFSDGWATVTTKFTPVSDQGDNMHPSLGFEIDGMQNGNFLCEAEGVECPLKKGVTQSALSKISVPRTDEAHPKTRSTAKFYLHDGGYDSTSTWYCVEFPVLY